MVKSKTRAIVYFLLLVGSLFVLNYAARFVFFRIDLTEDGRYTLTDASKRVMRNLENNVFVEIYLDGEMPIEMKKLRTSIKETLDELKVYGGSKLHYTFINIAKEVAPKDLERAQFMLVESGLSPIIVSENAADGSRSEWTLFPGAKIFYPNFDSLGNVLEPREIAVNFLENNSDINSDESLLIAQQNVESILVRAIASIVQKKIPRIAFVQGHGELDEYEVGDICKALDGYAIPEQVTINGNINALNAYSLVIVAKPMQPWSDDDKIVLDQYIMRGGRVAWFVDAVEVAHDSLSRGEYTFALACNHGLDEMLFKYGVRLNPTVISDLRCAYLPVNTALAGQEANFKLAPWTYYPLLTPSPQFTITKGLNLVESKYPSTIDVVGRDYTVVRHVLLQSSEYSRTQAVPLLISLSQTKDRPNPEVYQQQYLHAAVLLEGEFSSAYLNRPLQNYNHQRPFEFKQKSEPTKMIVVADGDIIRNDVVHRAEGTRIVPLGFNRYMNVQFGNRSFVRNCIFYLLDEDNIIQILEYEWTLRMLDKTKIYPERNYWVTLNTALPLLLTLFAGAFFIWLRKRKYAKRHQ